METPNVQEMEATEEIVTDDQVQSDVAPETLDPEAQLAAEALANVPETMVPVGVVAGLRAKGRDKDQVLLAKDMLIERLQAELLSREPVVEAVVELTPLEKYIQDHADDFDPEFDSPPAAVQIAERDFHARKQNDDTAARQKKELGDRSYAKAKSTLSDFDDIVEIGKKHLSRGDVVDISESDDPALKLYELCLDKTLKSKTEDAATLRQHLQTKVTTKKTLPLTNVKPVQEIADTEGEEQPLNPRLAQAYAMLEM